MIDTGNERATDDSDDGLITDLATGLMLAVTATGVLKGANEETITYAGDVMESELAKFCVGEGEYGVNHERVAAGTMHEGVAAAALVANCTEKIALFREPPNRKRSTHSGGSRENGESRRRALAMPLFHTHVVVDWSARSRPSPKSPAKDAIWWAVARIDGGVAVGQPDYVRTRREALDRLARLIAGELDQGRRVLVGFDFPFGYPGGVAAHLTGKACALALWDWLAAQIEDAPDNGNNRFDVAAAINRTYPGVGPFWGRPGTWSYPTVPVRASARTEQSAHPPERRIADHHAKGAKTVWQLAYAGSVGSQMLLGLPALKRLSEDPRIGGRAAIWPFETGLRTPDAPAVIAEVYPSLLRDEVRARQCDDEFLDSAQVRVNAEAFARLDAGGGLAPLFAGAPDLTQAKRRIVEKEEAWILGLGHEEALKGACRRQLPCP